MALPWVRLNTLAAGGRGELPEVGTFSTATALTVRRRGLLGHRPSLSVAASSDSKGRTAPVVAHGAAPAPPLNRSPQPLTSVRAALPAQSAASPALLLSVDISHSLFQHRSAPLSGSAAERGRGRENVTGAFARSCFPFLSSLCSFWYWYFAL